MAVQQVSWRKPTAVTPLASGTATDPVQVGGSSPQVSQWACSSIFG